LFFENNGTVEKVLFDFDVKEPHNDVNDSEDDAESLKETQGEQPEGRLRTQKGKKEVPTVIRNL
jgi:ribosomal RNA-processing protein 7